MTGPAAIVERILASYDSITVVGASVHPVKAAHYVPAHMQRHGWRIVPVNPHADVILGADPVKSRWPGTRGSRQAGAMTPSRERPPFVADERTQLIGWYDLQRSIVHLKCAGLSEVDAHRSVLPTSPLMTVAGVVSHLRWAEQLWFEVLFLDRPGTGPGFEGPEDSEMMVDGVPLAGLLDAYAAQCAVSNEIIAAHSLDDTGRSTDYPDGGATLRWMVIHMLEETARHAGHLDAMRELLDGQKGYY